MGSGKSHMAKKLAVIAHIEVMDLDQIIENEEGMSIREIFSQKGEEAFRQIESNALRQLVNRLSSLADNRVYVISCGGGTPCFHGNMEWMNEHGVTAWLNPSNEILVERLQKEKEHRPLIAALDDKGLTKFIAEKLNEREPFYSKAKIVLQESDPSVESILNLLQNA
ncbi:MAG: hypothetical protein RL131_459 [Bacteroidota bacterium]